MKNSSGFIPEPDHGEELEEKWYLKNYLMKGYAINNRMHPLEEKMDALSITSILKEIKQNF